LTLGRYSVLVLGVVLAALSLAWAVALRDVDAPAQQAALVGAVIAAANTLAAHALVRWSARRPTKAFFVAILGGMLGRMTLMLAAVVAGIVLLGLPRLPLAISLLSFFVLFLVVELSLLRRETPLAPGVPR
jgi:hypothetical protein